MSKVYNGWNHCNDRSSGPGNHTPKIAQQNTMSEVNKYIQKEAERLTEFNMPGPQNGLSGKIAKKYTKIGIEIGLSAGIERHMEFAEWVAYRKWYKDGDVWFSAFDNTKFYTISELFELFLKQKEGK